MALNDLTRISTSGIATGSTIDSPILRKDVSLRGSQVGVTSVLFDSSDDALEFNDNVSIKFGTGGDGAIKHTGSNLQIQETTGNIQIVNYANDKDVVISTDDGSGGTTNYFTADGSTGESIIYNYGNEKIKTTSTGAVVTGILTASSFSGPTNNTSGIATFYDLRVSNNLTVEGTTTTLDTNLIGVDRIEVGANSNSIVGVAITQSGTADIVNLFDGTTEVLTVVDGGSVGIKSATPDTQFVLDAIGKGIFTHGENVSSNDFNKGQFTVRNTAASQGAFLDFRATSGNGIGRGVIAKIGGFNTFSGTGYNGELTFSTRQNSDNTMVERLRITSDGDITFGVTASSTAITSGTIKQVSLGKDYWNGDKGHYGALRLLVYDNGVNDAYGFGISNGELEIQSQGNIGIYAGTTASDSKRDRRMFIGTSGDVIFGFNTSGSTNSSALFNMSLGGTYHNTKGSYPKLSLWHDGTDHMGFGVSSNQLDYILTSTNYDHVFYGGNAGTTELLRIKGGTGNVGINTNDPQNNAKFQHYTSTARYQSFQSTLGDLAIVSDNNSNPVAYIKGTGTADLLNVFDNTSEVFTIKDGGNVGIGTDSISQPLTIRRSSAGQGEFGVRLEYNNQTGPTNTSAALLVGSYGLKFKNYNSNRDFLFETGKVGIGTDDPDHSLHVYKEGGDSVITIESTGNGNDSALEFYRTSSGGNSMGAGSIYVTGNTGGSEAIMHFGVGHNIGHGTLPRLSIKGDGEVGIGTQDPSTMLHIKSTFPTLLVEGTNDTVGYTVSKVEVRAFYYRKAGFTISGDNGTEDIFIGRPYGSGETTAPLVFNFQGTEQVRIKSDGKVGIGTDQAVTSAQLDVWGDGSAYPTLRLGTEAYDTEGEDIRFGRMDIGGTDIRYHSIRTHHHADNSSNSMKFMLHDGGSAPYQSQNTVLTLRGDNKVGVAMDGPRTALEVNATHNTNNNEVTPVLRLSTGTSYGGTNTGSALEFGTTNTSYPTWIKGRIGCVYNGSSNYGGHLVFQTNTGSSATALSEKMRLTDAGIICVGTDESAMAVHTGTERGVNITGNGRVYCKTDEHWDLNHVGAGLLIRFRAGNDDGNTQVVVGNITLGTGSVAFNETQSDSRLKKNIEPWTDGVLQHFKTLQPKKFHFNWESDSDPIRTGYIAQDLVGAFPEAYPLCKTDIGESEEVDRHFFNPSGMVKYLMKALQEEIVKREEIEAKYNALEARISALEGS